MPNFDASVSRFPVYLEPPPPSRVSGVWPGRCSAAESTRRFSASGSASRSLPPLSGSVPAPTPSSASSSRITEPCETLSPSLTFISFTVPAAGEGTSIVALSDSSSMSGSSSAMVSPALTMTEMIGTSVKSPMSGTFTSIVDITCSPSSLLRRARVHLARVDLVFPVGLPDHVGLDLALLEERIDRRRGDVVRIDLEMAPQPRAAVGATETIGAEHVKRLRHEAADLLDEVLHVVGRGDHRPVRLAEGAGDIGHLRLGNRVHPVLAHDILGLAGEFVEARRHPEIGSDAEIRLEHVRRDHRLPEDRAAGHQVDMVITGLLRLPEAVEPLLDPFLDALGHRGMMVVLVLERDVVVDILLIGEHAPEAVLDDHRDLV